MKKFLSFLFYQLNIFLGNHQVHHDTKELEDFPYLDKIQLALYKKAAVHIIYANKSFTGEIIDFAPDKNRIIVKNFSRNITTIITLDAIQRVSLVPDSIRQSQKQ